MISTQDGQIGVLERSPSLALLEVAQSPAMTPQNCDLVIVFGVSSVCEFRSVCEVRSSDFQHASHTDRNSHTDEDRRNLHPTIALAPHEPPRQPAQQRKQDEHDSKRGPLRTSLLRPASHFKSQISDFKFAGILNQTERRFDSASFATSASRRSREADGRPLGDR